MSSRARIFAAVTLLASCVAGPASWAQVQNLEAGKSASQLFAGTCNACHKSPRGLLKTVSPGSLSGFLREHYTTSGDMASQLASYLISNGASDTRQAKDKPGADKQGQGGSDQADRQGRKNRNAPTQEAARPDDAAAPGEGGRQSRRRQTRPGDPSDDARAPAPAQAAIERSPDGRRLKRGRPGQPGSEEAPAASEPAKMEEPKSAKAEPGAVDKPKAEAPKVEAPKVEAPKTDTPKADTGTAERTKPDADIKSNEAKVEPPKDAGANDKPAGVRRDAMTPAPPPAASAPAAGSGASTEAAAPQPKAPAVAEPPAETASAPPPAPVQSGPPAPPISK
jgi:hypothetical protein